MKKMFYGSMLTITAAILLLTYAYFEAKQEVEKYCWAAILNTNPGIEHKVEFEKMSFSKSQVLHLWFVDTANSHLLYIPWGLWDWRIDQSSMFSAHILNEVEENNK